MTTLYGIKNCDTVQRARQALRAAQIDHRFHDFRVDGLSMALLEDFLKHIAAEQLINRRGTTWRQLTPSEQAQAHDARLAELLITHPSLIKRPVIQHGGLWRVGFSRRDEAEILNWLRY